MFGKFFKRALQTPGFQKVISEVKEKNTAKTVNVTVPKNKTSVKKVDPKMLQAKRKGKKYSILNTAMGLTDSIKTKKKTLLG